MRVFGCSHTAFLAATVVAGDVFAASTREAVCAVRKDFVTGCNND